MQQKRQYADDPIIASIYKNLIMCVALQKKNSNVHAIQLYKIFKSYNITSEQYEFEERHELVCSSTYMH